MESGEIVDLSLAEALQRLVVDLGVPRFERKEPGHFQLGDGELQIDVDGVPHINEIQIAVAFASPLGRERFSMDIVQEWLGERVQAYMFSDGNIIAASQKVSDVVGRIIERYRRGTKLAQQEMLAISQARASLFEINEIRRDADEAWDRKDFSAATKLYRRILNHLTPVELKRVSIGEKRLVP